MTGSKVVGKAYFEAQITKIEHSKTTLTTFLAAFQSAEYCFSELRLKTENTFPPPPPADHLQDAEPGVEGGVRVHAGQRRHVGAADTSVGQGLAPAGRLHRTVSCCCLSAAEGCDSSLSFYPQLNRLRLGFISIHLLLAELLFCLFTRNLCLNSHSSCLR